MGTDATIPSTKYVLNGSDASVTLPYKEGTEWYAVSDSGEAVDCSSEINGDGTVTVTFSQVKERVFLYAYATDSTGSYTITYEAATLSSGMQTLAGGYGRMARKGAMVFRLSLQRTPQMPMR